MDNKLFNDKTIERLTSHIKLSVKQKKASKKWLELMNKGELMREKRGYLNFYDLVLKEMLGYDNIKHEKEGIEFTYEKDGVSKVRFEAKGMDTKNLFLSQKRDKNESPVEQLWRYMNLHATPYGIVTNYKIFILYKHDIGSTKYHLFDFEKVKKDPNKLLEFVGLFSKESIDKGFLEEIYEKSIIEEREFTKEFYKLYHETRLMLIKEFETNSDLPRHGSVHFAQLFLNRLMFAFFAEDTGKLEKKVIENKILKTLENPQLFSSNSTIISNVLAGLFIDLDKGSDFPVKVFGFNGGLFKNPIPKRISFLDFRDEKFFKEVNQHSKLKKKDLELNEKEKEIFEKYKDKISPIIKNVLLMASFNFNTEVNVNILGHIFEQSISDIEDLKTNKNSRRKKEGIFYTPEYITDYICRNTIIPYLSEKGVNKVSDLIKEHANNIEMLENKFKAMKILDPACGSGAFLIKATDIMLEIFKAIQEFKQSGGEYEAFKLGTGKLGKTKLGNMKGQLVLGKWNEEDEAREIIENSIYGVDINEESVGITKLALFLKMARKNRKLTDLSGNIKQGNSLIDDKKIAGDLAFDWDKEFPFKFDVVIGNPPYVKARDYENVQVRKYIDNKYKTAYKMWDLYVPFIERGVSLLKEKGNFSMIIPDTIGKAEYTSKLVSWIESDHYLYQIDFFPESYVFEKVGVKSKIIFINKQKQSKKTKRVAHIPDISSIKKLNFIDEKEKYLYEQAGINLKFNECLNLDNICLVSYGLRLNSDKHDKKGKFKKEDLLSEKRTEINNKSYTEGKFLERYVIKKKLFVEWETQRSPNRLVRPTFPELYPPKKLLMSRQKRIATLSTDGEICDNTIIMGILVKNLHGVENKSISKYFKNIGKDRLELEKISENYNLSYLLSLINSKLMKYFIRYNSKGEIDTYPDDWKKIPIKILSPEEQRPLIEKAEKMLELNKEFYNGKDKFITMLKSDFSLEKISKKLQKWYELDWSEFEDELKKKKISLLGNKKDDWFDRFNRMSKDLLKLRSEIDKTDEEINKMVYDLYGLTNEEIGIVEES